MRNVIIIGGGPAAYTAALYTARADLKPLVFEGSQPGGQLTLTTVVENYPGFPDGIQGPELMAAMRAQAERFGAELRPEEVERVDFIGSPLVVWAAGKAYEARSVVVASGASARMLGLPAEKKLLGRGVSTCATCDGAFFRDREVVVVGGGDSAMEEALFLTKFARRVTVVHRRGELRASRIMQKRAFENPKIDFVWNSVVEDILDPAAGRVTAVRLKNRETGTVTEHRTDGVFIAIGHEPNTRLFQGQLELDARGYVVLKPREGWATATSVPGVFAAGDVADPTYRQAVTAAATGCQAAMDVERFLQGEAVLDWGGSEAAAAPSPAGRAGKGG